MNVIELTCVSCQYEAAVSNAVESAKDRMTPEECPQCGGELEIL